jgi:hypothetical protein
MSCMWRLRTPCTTAVRYSRCAATFLRDLPAGDYPYLAEHVEQHLAAPGDNGGFEFGLGLILDGLKKAHGIA